MQFTFLVLLCAIVGVSSRARQQRIELSTKILQSSSDDSGKHEWFDSVIDNAKVFLPVPDIARVLTSYWRQNPFTVTGCRDRARDYTCNRYRSFCNDQRAGWKGWMKKYCTRTCGFCTVSTPSPSPNNPTCGIKGRGHTRIVGGDIVAPGDWPWQVTYDLMGNTNNPGHWCGASILSPHWILTAAHCFAMSQNPEDYTLTVGDFDISKDEGHEQQIKIEKIILHEKYDSLTFDFDIALIKLRNPIRFTERVRPVCLPHNGMDFETGKNCYVTGWGKLQELGNFPKRLYQAKVPLVDRQKCTRAYATNHGYTITERMRCAGFTNGGIDACQGDSGGPLVCNRGNQWYLMGAVSWGVGCARSNAYGVYTDIANLKPWVVNAMKN